MAYGCVQRSASAYQERQARVRRLPKRGPLAGAARVVASLYVAGLLLWALLHALVGDRYWWTFLLNTFALYLFVPLPAVMLVVLLSGSALAWLPTAVAAAMWAYLYGSLFVPRGSAPADNETALTVMTFNVLAYALGAHRPLGRRLGPPPRAGPPGAVQVMGGRRGATSGRLSQCLPRYTF